MVIVTCLYLALVYLIFFKYELLPFNKVSQTVVVVIGTVILTLFLVGLQTVTPASVQAFVGGFITEIAPQVSGRVTEVPVSPNTRVEPGDVLFEIDPRPYQYRVDQLKAQLVETEAYVAQLKESYDAARAQTSATRTQLALSELRLKQNQRLVEAGAGSRFELERYETEVAAGKQSLAAAEAQENQAFLSLTAEVGDQQSRVAQVLAQLDGAQFDLENASVMAPAEGIVTMNVLREGMQVSPYRAVMTFIHADDVGVPALFAQKSLEQIRVGDGAQVSFPALPGRVFDAEVRSIPSAIGEAQFAAAGQLPLASEQRMTRLYPVMTESAGVVGIVATILHWIQTSMDYIV